MGMYTELSLDLRLAEDVPPEVLDILRFMLEGDPSDERPILPRHPLFGDTRWAFMLRCCSYYHTPVATMALHWDDITKAHFLVGRCDLKNYDNEINLFIDWLTPYIEAEENEFLGHQIYEEDERPTLLFYPNRWEHV